MNSQITLVWAMVKVNSTTVIMIGTSDIVLNPGSSFKPYAHGHITLAFIHHMPLDTTCIATAAVFRGITGHTQSGSYMLRHSWHVTKQMTSRVLEHDLIET